MHVTTWLFELHETSEQSMAIQLQSLLEKYGLLHQVIAFVKDEGSNLTIMATILQSIVDCGPLKLLRVYDATCFGHLMSKACQYVTNDDKIFSRLKSVNVKDAHMLVYKKQLPGPKSLGKGGRMGVGFLL